MKHWQMRRSLALLLLLVTVFSAAIPFTVSAAETDMTEEEEKELYGGRTIDEILNLISGSTYDDYATKNGKIDPAKVSRDEPIILYPDSIVKEGDPDFKDNKTNEDRTTADYIIGTPSEFGIDEMVDTFGKTISGVQVVYTPSSGKITYKIDIPADGISYGRLASFFRLSFSIGF